MSKVMAVHGDYIYKLFNLLEDRLFIYKVSYKLLPEATEDNCCITFTAWGVPEEIKKVINDKLKAIVCEVFGEDSKHIEEICMETHEECTIKDAIMIYDGFYDR